MSDDITKRTYEVEWHPPTEEDGPAEPFDFYGTSADLERHARETFTVADVERITRGLLGSESETKPE